MLHSIKSFVMRRGNITKSQQQALSTMGNEYIIPYTESIYDFNKISNNRPIILEIGFGMGIATAIIAQNNPNNFYLGIEVYNAGIGRLLLEIKDRNLDNIRIIQQDAVAVMNNMIKPNSLDAVHVFFPDPWHKKKHNKRRLLKTSFLETLSRSLKQDGYLYIVTDWQDYAEEILVNLEPIKSLYNQYTSYAPTQEWRPSTKFEEKGLLKNHQIFEIMLKRI